MNSHDMDDGGVNLRAERGRLVDLDQPLPWVNAASETRRGGRIDPILGR